MIPAKLIPFISPDPSLRAIVHREQIGPFQLIATLTRFGGLCVTVWEGDEAIHQGENVIIARLEANRAMDSRVLERTRIALAAEGGPMLKAGEIEVTFGVEMVAGITFTVPREVWLASDIDARSRLIGQAIDRIAAQAFKTDALVSDGMGASLRGEIIGPGDHDINPAAADVFDPEN